MIIIDVLILIIIGVAVGVGISKLGRPLIEAYADRLRTGQSGADAAHLKSKVDSLEAEVVDLRQQLLQVKETADFAVKLLEDKEKS